MVIGRSLGPYRIVEQIGAGAMGEVYRARDTRLGRDVAIKILPTQLAGKPERLARFEREARAAAALNHPHIAAVYDVGCETLARPTIGGAESPPEEGPGGSEEPVELHFIVQEHLHGETLRRRIDRRPPGIEEALRLGAEIAGALASAHAAGIVHRDLKPDNVFITTTGHAKVLDFGLAKLVDAGDVLSGEPSLSTTVPDSVSGRIVGTPGYMAPEQVNGEPSDRRTDIFAFGATLYEMATGKRAFGGRSAADSLARVVHEEPLSIGEIDDALPLELSRIIGKCLQKEPARRYQTADDLAIDLSALQTAVAGGAAVSAKAGAAGRTGDRALGRLGLPAVAITAVLAALVTWTLVPEVDPPPAPVLYFSVNLPEGVGITRTERPVVATSGDGQKIVVAANGALWLRDLGRERFVRLEGTAPSTRGGYAVAPAFSPNGDNVAFFLEGAIRRVALAGGAPISLRDAHIPSSIHWGTDGYVYYTQARAAGGGNRAFGSENIWRVPENGGNPEIVVEVGEDRRAAAPHLLPGGEWLLFSTTGATDFVMEPASHEEVAVQSLRTGARLTLIDNGFAGRYVDTGHLLYLEGSSLWAVPFNLDGLGVTGGATKLIESVPMSYWAGTPYMGIADNGNLVVPALALLQQRNGELSWVRGDGDVQSLEVPLADNPRLSRDGTKVVAEVRGVAETRIWVHEIDRSTWTDLTPESGGAAPVWSPDGRWIYYMATDSENGSAVWRKSADFTSPAELVWRPEGHVPYPESIPEDGRFLVYSASLGDQNDVWLVWLDGERRAQPLIESSDTSEEGPQIHPSGRWIAYAAAQTGRYEVYVQEVGETGSLGRRYVISTFGGAEPMWSHDGRTLFYRSGAQLIAVSCELDDGFRAGEQRVLMREFPGDTPVLRADYDVAPDGRFLTSLPQAEWSNQRLDVVINWFSESGLRATR